MSWIFPTVVPSMPDVEKMAQQSTIHLLEERIAQARLTAALREKHANDRSDFRTRASQARAWAPRRR